MNVNHPIFLLTNDGHRDSVDLNHYASNGADLKKNLIAIVLDRFDWKVFPDSIHVDFFEGKITFGYEKDGQNESGLWHFFTINDCNN